MGVRIINDEMHAVLYDSVTDIAFGPVFYGLGPSESGMDWDIDAEEMAEAFLNYLSEDARTYDPDVLMSEYWNFRNLIERDGWEAVSEGVTS